MIDVIKETSVCKLISFEMSEFSDSPPKIENTYKVIICKDKKRYDPRKNSSKYVSHYVKKI